MESVGTAKLSISAQMLDADIAKYVTAHLSRDNKLSRLDHATKRSIEEAVVQGAQGMFLWVSLVLHDLKKSIGRSSIKATLELLPTDLNETYERVLSEIKGDDRHAAVTVLLWLAYANTPLSLQQLAEISTFHPDNPTTDGAVALNNPGHLENTLNILAGLVLPENAYGSDQDSQISRLDMFGEIVDEVSDTQLNSRWTEHTTFRLCHSSLKEYLLSMSILASDVKDFYLDPVRAHWSIAQTCLGYLSHYSNSSQKTSTEQDLETFPLLEYAAKAWPQHIKLRDCDDSERELSLLTSETRMRDWLLVYDPDQDRTSPFRTEVHDFGSALYHTSLLRLKATAGRLLNAGADVNAQGGRHGNALQAASSAGHTEVVQLLLDHRADVNAQGGENDNALQAASAGGHTEVVQLLLDHMADVNVQGGYYGNALNAAASQGHTFVVQQLLDNHADVNGQGPRGTALQAAASHGHMEIVQLLLDFGAEVDAQGEPHGTALQAASHEGYMDVVQLLLNYEADANARGGLHGNALQAASFGGHKKIVQLLLSDGAHRSIF
ncbi:hypothetical protein LTR10_010005 [Elasticomyces elasticus]|nr:hypothetical protein LTR10_010005 [Elasticomyces elasticus]KAK4970297.1 hypothetical protein LTR42_008464 [Elasticomyces elasticus]